MAKSKNAAFISIFDANTDQDLEHWDFCSIIPRVGELVIVRGKTYKIMDIRWRNHTDELNVDLLVSPGPYIKKV